MKKIFCFILLGMVVSGFAMAQTKTRKIPFLPYTGMTTTPTVAATARPVTTTSAPTSKPYETIFFNTDSSSLRADQKKKMMKIGKRMEKEGASHYSVVAFSTPNISSDLARRRAETVVHALSDFNVGYPVIHYEYRASSVIDPNRVEVYMKPSVDSLGAASSNFGRR